MPFCKKCNKKNVCEQCDLNKYLKVDKTACVDTCINPEGPDPNSTPDNLKCMITDCV